MVKVLVVIMVPAGFCALVVGIAYDIGGMVSQILAEWGTSFR